MERRKSGLRPAIMPPMPGASGIECIRALVSLGWMPAWWTDCECQLEKEPLSIRIPLDPVLRPEVVAAIVNLAGVSPLAFIEALEQIVTRRIANYASELKDSRKTA